MRLHHGLPRRDSTCAHFTWRPLLYSLAGSSAGAFLTGHYTGQRSLLVLCTLQQFPPREYTGSWLPSFPNLVQPSLRTNGAAPQDPTLTTRYFKMHCETVNKFQVIGCGSLDMPKNAVCVLWLTLSRYWHCWWSRCQRAVFQTLLFCTVNHYYAMLCYTIFSSC